MNKQKERLEECGDITLNLDYWDCECKQNFIHPISQPSCPICLAEEIESPSSRANEVDLLIYRKKA
jgi:hypothetical protein